MLLPLELPVPVVSLGATSSAFGVASSPATTSMVIVGCWQMSAGHRPDTQYDEAERFQALGYMLRRGACSFDCGDIYTGVEHMLGCFSGSKERHQAALEGALAPKVHTKFVPDLSRLINIEADYVEASLRRSIRRLRLPPGQPLELVQFHWWDFAAGDYVAVAQHLASFASSDAGDKGRLVKNIGLTNFGTQELRRVLDADVPVASVQVQFSLLDRRPLTNGLLFLCACRGVSVLCYGVLAGGLLSDKYVGEPEPAWFTSGQGAPNRSLTKYALILQECGGWSVLQMLLRELQRIAEKQSLSSGRTISISQIAIAWVFRQQAVTACILGLPCAAGDNSSNGRQKAADLIDSVNVELSTSEMNQISAALRQIQVPKGECYELERERDSAHGRIMHYELSRVGEDVHAEEVLAAWHDPEARARGGPGFAERLAWEAQYCLREGRLSADVSQSLRLSLDLIQKRAIAEEPCNLPTRYRRPSGPSGPSECSLALTGRTSVPASGGASCAGSPRPPGSPLPSDKDRLRPCKSPLMSTRRLLSPSGSRKTLPHILANRAQEVSAPRVRQSQN